MQDTKNQDFFVLPDSDVCKGVPETRPVRSTGIGGVSCNRCEDCNYLPVEIIFELRSFFG